MMVASSQSRCLSTKLRLKRFDTGTQRVAGGCLVSFAAEVNFVSMHCSIEDVQRKVTSVLVRDARLAELKHEVRACA